MQSPTDIKFLGAVPKSVSFSPLCSGRIHSSRHGALIRCSLRSRWPRIYRPRASLGSSNFPCRNEHSQAESLAATPNPPPSAYSPSAFVQISSVWTALLIISTVLASKLTNMTAKLQQLLFKGSGSDVLVEVGLGIVLTLPLVLAGLALQSPLMESLVPGIQDMKRFLAQNAKPILSECSTLQIVVLAIQAGVGEEMFFRGFLQPFLTQIFGQSHVLAILCSSVLFGLGHNVTALYMLVSTSFSVYLGWVSLATSSLISPIVAHALYDLIAFYQVIRLK